MQLIDMIGVTDDVIAPMVFGNSIGSLLLVVETLLGKIVSVGSKIDMANIINSLGLGIGVDIIIHDRDRLGFEALVEQLIDQHDIKSDFKIAYLCRNQNFHGIKSEKIYGSYYMEITQSVFNCIFYAIEHYY